MNFSPWKRRTMSPKDSKIYHHVRSISLPASLHPSTIQVESELNKLKTRKSSPPKAEEVGANLSGLGELYKCLGELLTLPLTQQALAQQQHQKWVNDLLEESVKYIDTCSKIRDIVLMMKESLQKLQSALRKRMIVNYTSIECDVFDYVLHRKKMRKEAAKSLVELKQSVNRNGEAAEASTLLNSGHHLSAVARVIREASLITISIFQSLLLVLSSPVGKAKPTKWSLVSKLVHKGVVNEMEKLETELLSELMLLYSSSSHKDDASGERIPTVHGRLVALNESVEGLESGLECLVRHLIGTRVCLLNILSH